MKSANTVLLQPSAAGAMQRRKRMEKVWSIQRVQCVQMRSVRSSISAFWNQPVAPVGTNEHLEYFEGTGSLHHMAITRLHRFLAMEFCKSENPIGESSASLSHCHNADYVNNTQIIKNIRIKIYKDFFQTKSYKKGSNAWHRYGSLSAGMHVIDA
jgi:hypothetical protein